MKLAAVLAITSLCCNSCILPVPHRRVHIPGVKGQVIDEQTNQPVVDAKIISVPGNSTLVITDDKGKFKVKPVYGWHGAYLLGPISYSLFPHFDMPYVTSVFLVDADGYINKMIRNNGVIHVKPSD